jgi:hypothetical protein
MSVEEVRKCLQESLKGRPYIFRSDIARKSIDGFTKGALSNLDCKGRGPKNAFTVGKRVAYPIPEYIDWVISRISGVS